MNYPSNYLETVSLIIDRLSNLTLVLHRFQLKFLNREGEIHLTKEISEQNMEIKLNLLK